MVKAKRNSSEWSDTRIFYDNFAIKVKKICKSLRCNVLDSFNKFWMYSKWLHYPPGSIHFTPSSMLSPQTAISNDKLEKIMWSRPSGNFLIKWHRSLTIAILFNFKCQSWLLQIVCTWKKSIAHGLTSEIRLFDLNRFTLDDAQRRRRRRRKNFKLINADEEEKLLSCVG